MKTNRFVQYYDDFKKHVESSLAIVGGDLSLETLLRKPDQLTTRGIDLGSYIWSLLTTGRSHVTNSMENQNWRFTTTNRDYKSEDSVSGTLKVTTPLRELTIHVVPRFGIVQLDVNSTLDDGHYSTARLVAGGGDEAFHITLKEYYRGKLEKYHRYDQIKGGENDHRYSGGPLFTVGRTLLYSHVTTDDGKPSPGKTIRGSRLIGFLEYRPDAEQNFVPYKSFVEFQPKRKIGIFQAIKMEQDEFENHEMNENSIFYYGEWPETEDKYIGHINKHVGGALLVQNGRGKLELLSSSRPVLQSSGADVYGEVCILHPEGDMYKIEFPEHHPQVLGLFPQIVTNGEVMRLTRGKLETSFYYLSR